MKELEKLAEDFEMLIDWDQRYQYLIELGESLPAMPASLKTENNKVKGCMSQVWTSPYFQDMENATISFYGDCDTAIIKGVLAVLVKLCNGKTKSDILSLDIDEIFAKLHLDEHLSPNRHIGIFGIVDQMQQQAKALKEKDLAIGE